MALTRDLLIKRRDEVCRGAFDLVEFKHLLRRFLTSCFKSSILACAPLLRPTLTKSRFETERLKVSSAITKSTTATDAFSALFNSYDKLQTLHALSSIPDQQLLRYELLETSNCALCSTLSGKDFRPAMLSDHQLFSGHGRVFISVLPLPK